jgi:hypothetical protein
MAHLPQSARLARFGSLWSLAGALLLSLGTPSQAAEPARDLTDPLGQRVVLLQGEAPAKAPDKGEHHHPGRNATIRELANLSLEQLMELEIVPINVLGGHTHPAGQWMVGYRYMYQSMGGNLNGTESLSNARLLRRYLDVPTSMQMEMHMLEAMYAPSDRLTLMLMAPYSRMWMERDSLLPGGHHHGSSSGGGGNRPAAQAVGPTKAQNRFETRSAGWGDLTLMSLYTLSGGAHGSRRLLFNGGLSVPTGSIDAGHSGGRHEYMMQLGSGTVDLMPGLTYLGEDKNWSWGGQLIGTIRLGTNDNNYRLGNRVKLNAWSSYRLSDAVAPSIRLEAQHWGQISGRDVTLDPLVDPTFDPRNYGGERIDLLLGVNLYAPKGRYKGMRLTVEGGIPVYQSLDGPQLETDWMLGFSLSYAR